MSTIIKSIQSASTLSHPNWSFLLNILSGIGGIIIGWAIAFMLGWT